MKILNLEQYCHKISSAISKCAILGLITLSSSLCGQENAPLDPTEEQVIRHSRPKQSDTASIQLIQNYLTVTGGKTKHVRLRNVVASGVIEEAGRTKNFVLIETQDGKRHLTYRWKHLGREYEVVYVFDGLKTWTRNKKPKLEDARTYGGLDGTHFRYQRWLLQPFILPSSASYVFKYQGTAKVGGRPTHVVVGYGKNNERSWFYFDQEKFLLLRWGGFGGVAGVKEPLDYRASRFKSTGGVLLPKEIDLLVENAAFGTVTIEKIEGNQNLDNINFFMPQSTTPMLRQRKKPAE